MKTKLLLLATLALGGSLFGQGTPVKNLYGSGTPNANLASVVGTTYVDQSTSPATMYTCTAVTQTATLSQCTWTAAAGGVSGVVGGTFGGSPSSGYTFTVVAGTVSAVNNKTGVVDYTGADAAVVINAAMNNIAATCGTLYFKNGIYNLNSVTQETHTGIGQGSAYTHYFAIGIPKNTTATGYCQWRFEGESQLSWIDSNPVQVSGVILNVTSTAITAAGAATNQVVGIWQIPDTVNGFGPRLYFENFTLRMPNNQRSCENGINPWEALDVQYYNVRTDFATDPSTAVPVSPVTAGCTGVINTFSGLVSTQSGHNNIQHFVNTVSVGYWLAYEFDSEHLYAENPAARYCQIPFEYGLRGGGTFGGIYQTGVMIRPITLNSIQDMVLGPTLLQGSRLDIIGYGAEIQTAGIWTRTTKMTEANVGYTSGVITYTILSGVNQINEVPNPFQAGQGTSFRTEEGTSPPTYVRSPTADALTRPNSATLGPSWVSLFGTGTGLNGTLQIISNTAAATAGSTDAAAFYAAIQPVSFDQFSKATVSACDANGVEVWVNGNGTTNNANTANGYRYFVSTNGHFVQKYVAGVKTTLQTNAAVTCSAGDVIEIDNMKGTIVVYQTHSGVTTSEFPPTIDTTVTGGAPGIGSAGTADALTNFVGGTFPARTDTDTIYGKPFFAPTYNTLTECLAAGSAIAASAVACGSASNGLFSIPITTPTSAVVTTTALTQNSTILVQQRLDTTTGAGAALAVTCNTTPNTTAPNVTARTATTFTITFAAFTTNPGCYQYDIKN